MPRWTLCLTLAGAAWAMPAHGVLAADPILRIETGMHTARISDAAIVRGRNLLVTVSDDKTARVWTLPELRLVQTLRPPIDRGRVGELYAVAVTHTRMAGDLVAVGGWLTVENEYAVDVFGYDFSRLTKQFKVPSTVSSLAISEDGAFLAAGLYGGEVRVWQLADGEVKLADRKNYSGAPVVGVDFAADGRLAASSDDGDIRLYDSALNLVKRQATEAGRHPHKVKFSPDGRDLAIGFDDRPAVEVRSAADLSLRTSRTVSGSGTGGLGVVAWSSNGEEVLATGTYPFSGIGPSSILAWQNRGAGARWGFALKDTVVSILPLR